MIHRILGIPGSLRRNSLNRALLETAGELLPENAKLELADLSDLPIYNWDIEQEVGYPDPVLRFRQQISDADGLLFATPEVQLLDAGCAEERNRLGVSWRKRRPDQSQGGGNHGRRGSAWVGAEPRCTCARY